MEFSLALPMEFIIALR